MNIYQLQTTLLEIFDELEENGGELTPELEEELKVTQESFKTKIKDYVSVIKSLTTHLTSIKEEQKRLKELYERKEKTISRLKDIVVDAIEKFGDTKRSGVKFIDYTTGQVSIRTTQAVDADEDLIKAVGLGLQDWLRFNKSDNQLDVTDKIDDSELTDLISEDVEHNDGTYIPGYKIDEDELNAVNAEIVVKIPIKDITSGTGYNAIKEIAKYTDDYSIKTTIDKTQVKTQLKENGSCLPHLAKLKTNKTITIK